MDAVRISLCMGLAVFGTLFAVFDWDLVLQGKGEFYVIPAVFWTLYGTALWIVAVVKVHRRDREDK